MLLNVDLGGRVRCLYDESIDLAALGILSISRASLCCAVDSEQIVYNLAIKRRFLIFQANGLHYKTRSGLKRSGNSRPRAVRMRFASASGRATRRSTSSRPSVVGR